MALEIELKMRVGDLGKVRRILEEQGAKPKGKRLEPIRFWIRREMICLNRGRGCGCGAAGTWPVGR